jgi:hypothetical protein
MKEMAEVVCRFRQSKMRNAHGSGHRNTAHLKSWKTIHRTVDATHQPTRSLNLHLCHVAHSLPSTNLLEHRTQPE